MEICRVYESVRADNEYYWDIDIYFDKRTYKSDKVKKNGESCDEKNTYSR